MRIDLKIFRQSHNLFQSEMAEILQMNQSNVSRAELRGYLELTYNQHKALCERFGEENVDSFAIEDANNRFVSVTGNSNSGDGTQNNGVFNADINVINIIKQQSEAIVRLADKQSQQTERILTLIEKLSEKL